MNERQNMVVANVVVFLMLTIVYLCPWRIESSGELRWSPIYQKPLTYVRSYDDTPGARESIRIESREAHIAVMFLVLEALAVITIGGLLYVFFADSKNNGE